MTGRGAGSTVSRRRAVFVAGGSAIAGLTIGSGVARAVDGYDDDNRPPSYRISPPSPRSGVFDTQIVWRTAGPSVALTFDDGPDPRWTPRILDILAAADARATFFVLRDHVLAHPELVRRAADAGHEIGVHGADHWDMTRLTSAQLDRSLADTKRAVADLVGREPVLMRPPYGRFDAPVLHAARSHGLQLILWSDWLPGRNSASASAALLAQLTPGAVILCHDGRRTPSEQMVSALRTFVPSCVAKGLRLATVSELLAER